MIKAPPAMVEEIQNMKGRKPKPKKKREDMNLQLRKFQGGGELCIVEDVEKMATM